MGCAPEPGAAILFGARRAVCCGRSIRLTRGIMLVKGRFDLEADARSERWHVLLD